MKVFVKTKKNTKTPKNYTVIVRLTQTREPPTVAIYIRYAPLRALLKIF